MSCAKAYFNLKNEASLKVNLNLPEIMSEIDFYAFILNNLSQFLKNY